MCVRRIQAYKYELMPSGDQQRHMRRFAGSCRFVFNNALGLQRANHAGGKSQEVIVKVSNITVSNRNGKWFVSLQSEREVEQPVAQGHAVSIDVDIVRFARFRMEPSTPRSTSLSDMLPTCVKHSKP
jgi:Helix-turn-helix domain